MNLKGDKTTNNVTGNIYLTPHNSNYQCLTLAAPYSDNPVERRNRPYNAIIAIIILNQASNSHFTNQPQKPSALLTHLQIK